MRKVWRSGSRVLSAILAAAMIFTSVPTTSLSAYAEETTAQELTLDEGAAAVTDDVVVAEEETSTGETTPVEEETPAEEAAPAEGETPSEGDTSTEVETPSEGDTSAEGETPAEGDTTPADEETPAEDETASEDEVASTDETTAVDETVVEDETTLDTTEEISLASDGDATPESDFTWDGTTITGYVGAGGDIVIPAKATAIADAFYENTSITSVSFAGNSVTSIDSGAFQGCSNLRSITLPQSLTELPGGLFMDCTSLTEVNLPDGLVALLPHTFLKCTSLETIDLPDSLKTIYNQAFSYCSSLREINLPEGLQTILSAAFDGCTSLTEINFPASLKTIGYQAFNDCTGLEVLRFEGAGNVDIDKTAFDGIDSGVISVYCASGSKAYKYFNGKEGFRVVMTYTIKYVLNGGTNAEENPTSYTTGDDITIADPTKQGYTFGGWYTDAKFTKPFSYDSESTNGNLTLYAKWEGSAYKLVYNKNGKDAVGTMDSIVLSSTEEYTIPEEGYTRAGYDFLGWNTKADGKGKTYVEGDVVQGLSTKDGATVTLYAQWQKGIYEINYVLNDNGDAVNNKNNPNSYTKGQTIKLQNPTRSGYTFGGWYTDEECTEKVTKITSDLGDVTIYALWTENGYTITFHANKGTGTMDTITAAFDEEIKLPDCGFTRVGYGFSGWNTQANGKGKSYTATATYSGLASKNNAKVTLYAQWSPLTYAITYENLEDAVNTNPERYRSNQTLTLKNPTRTGYTFKGWFTDAAFTQKVSKIAGSTRQDVTIYAKWDENSYTLKLDKNGGTYAIPAGIAGKHTYTEEVTLPDGDGATRNNYELTGWNTKKNRSGQHYDLGATASSLATKGTVTLYAEWTPVEDKTYSITYYGAGDPIDNSKNPTTYSFEKDVKLVSPVWEGHTFKGWYTADPTENPKAKKVTTISRKTTGDVAVYASWSENSYTIAYNANKGTLPKGQKMAAQKVKYTESVNLTANAFTRKGYEFIGWNTKANGTGTSFTNEQNVDGLTGKAGGKVTLYAQWQAVDYNITYEYVGIGDDPSLVIENPNPKSYTIAKDVSLKNVSYYGYTFKGWYSDDPTVNTKAKKIAKIAKTTCKDMTVYGLWSENSYNLRFSTNTLLSGVKTITNKRYTADITIPKTVPEKDGYTFKGWALTRNGAAVYQPEDTITFEELYEAGSTARGLVGTKYFTLYAVFEAQ